MSYYELIKEYGKGKSEAVMWASTKRVSDFLEPFKESHPKEYWALIKDTYAMMCGAHYNEEFACWQIEQMYYKDKSGSKIQSPHWTKAEYKASYEMYKGKLRDASYNCWDWAVTIEMQRADYYCMLKEWMPDATDEEIDKKVMCLALAYLNDDDGEEGKIWKRFNG